MSGEEFFKRCKTTPNGSYQDVLTSSEISERKYSRLTASLQELFEDEPCFEAQFVGQVGVESWRLRLA